MNRFDRVTSLLLLLQTRSVVTASFLAEHFAVTERTVYRDIRTLENAGVPIGSEPGVGYFLEKGYRLPPVSFTLNEAAALLLGEKLLSANLDQNSHADYSHALNKVRSVLDTSDKDHLSSLDADIEVMAGDARRESAEGDRWLRESRSVLVRRQVVRIVYAAGMNAETSKRQIEPIGLFHYSLHWHLIAWCRLREAYRDFRLDRITEFEPLAEQFPRHTRSSLQDYLAAQQAQNDMLEVELLFIPEVARFVGEARYLYGFISEELEPGGVRMQFITPSPGYMARWLLQYTSGVQIIKGDGLEAELASLADELKAHWQPS